MNDEKTTEIEIPAKFNNNNIVRVNFAERRKPTTKAPSFESNRSLDVLPPIPFRATEELKTPWWIRLAALATILILSLFVL